MAAKSSPPSVPSLRLPTSGPAPGASMRSPRAGARPTMSNFGAFIPRPQAQTEGPGAAGGYPGGSSSSGGARSPRLSFAGMRVPGASSPRGMAGSQSSSPGLDFFASAASFIGGALSPRGEQRGERPPPGGSLKQALASRGGVQREKDGFEVFYGVEAKEKRSPRLRKDDYRDGFDIFYGIKGGPKPAEEARETEADEAAGRRPQVARASRPVDSQAAAEAAAAAAAAAGASAGGARRRPGEAASDLPSWPLASPEQASPGEEGVACGATRTSRRPARPEGVPEGVPTFSLSSGRAKTGLPKHVETYSLCDPPAVPRWRDAGPAHPAALAGGRAAA